jgi:hypothetical protein
MNRPRALLPIEPERWIRARPGPNFKALQHVVAYRVDEAFPENLRWFFPTLCAKTVSGSTPRMNRTLKPMVTAAPKDGHPVCQECVQKLANVRAEQKAGYR